MNILTKIKKTLIDVVGDIRIYPGGIVLFGKSNYKINGVDQRQIINAIQPGDLIFRRFNHYIGCILVPGYWSHVGIYIGDNYIIHAAGGGVTIDDILTFTRADSVSVLRCSNKNIIEPAKSYCQIQLKNQVPYDFDFQPNNDALYCSEMIWEAFDRPICKQKMDKYVIPDDLFTAVEFNPVIEIRK